VDKKMSHFEHARKITKTWPKWKQKIKITPIKTNLDLVESEMKVNNINFNEREKQMKATSKSVIAWYVPHDLSTKEVWREYRFPDNEVVHIDNPQSLIVTDNGHRIGAGTMSYYIPYGWIELKWLNCADRKENFICEEKEE
jgi:hypothetical protein